MITELDLLRTRLDARRELLNVYLEVPVQIAVRIRSRFTFGL